MFSILCTAISTALREALRPDTLPDRSEVTQFSKGNLKHVDTTEKNVLPDKKGESNPAKVLLN